MKKISFTFMMIMCLMFSSMTFAKSENNGCQGNCPQGDIVNNNQTYNNGGTGIGVGTGGNASIGSGAVDVDVNFDRGLVNFERGMVDVDQNSLNLNSNSATGGNATGGAANVGNVGNVGAFSNVDNFSPEANATIQKGAVGVDNTNLNLNGQHQGQHQNQHQNQNQNQSISNAGNSNQHQSVNDSGNSNQSQGIDNSGNSSQQQSVNDSGNSSSKSVQGQTAHNAGNSQNIQINNPRQPKMVPSMANFVPMPTSPCMATIGGAGAGAGFGFSISGSYINTNCEIQEAAKTMLMIGQYAAAVEIACTGKHAAAASICQGIAEENAEVAKAVKSSPVAIGHHTISTTENKDNTIRARAWQGFSSVPY